jgi:hypothetical protein
VILKETIKQDEHTNLGCDGQVEGSRVGGSEPVEMSLCSSVTEKSLVSMFLATPTYLESDSRTSQENIRGC